MRSKQYNVTTLVPAGRVSNANVHSLPAGAASVQNNIGPYTPGVWKVRPGCRPTSFANSTTANTLSVIGCAGFNRPEARWVVYQLSDGRIYSGRTPT